MKFKPVEFDVGWSIQVMDDSGKDLYLIGHVVFENRKNASLCAKALKNVTEELKSVVMAELRTVFGES
jgi:hypothetical protein